VVEVITVVAIIALITAIVLPAMRLARHSARTAACLSQVRALQQAHLSYATDHRGLLADVGFPHGGLGFPEQSFITTLKPWLDDERALHSPLDRSVHWPSSAGGEGIAVPASGGALRRSSYGMNNYLSRNFSPAAALDPGTAADRLSRIPAPASTAMVLFMAEEGPFAGSDHPHVEEWWVSAQAADAPPVIASSQVATGAAGGKAKSWDARSNWGFVDGHVATLPFGEIYHSNQINRLDPQVAGTFTARTSGGS
jgi:prepilin-type processing-associated H-X9-DG protein